MDITIKEPEKIKFITHEFIFLFGKAVTIDLYPSMGDDMTETKVCWTFVIPRLNITKQEVYRAHCIGHEVVEGERVYTATKEVVREFIKTKRREKVEKERRDAENAQD
jgi:hypothetical protein